MDYRRHLSVCHKLTEEQYRVEFCKGESPQVKIVKQDVFQPFECKICGKGIKYDRNTLHTHLKNVHGINWTKYLDRIRRLQRGLEPEPEPLPVMKMVSSRVLGDYIYSY